MTPRPGDSLLNGLGVHLGGGEISCCIATFFFWNSGMNMQKSIQGLLRCLLFQILGECPDLIPFAFPTRWTTLYTKADNLGDQIQPQSFRLKELQIAFENVSWLHGYPGLGKSVIAKYLIDRLLEGDGAFLQRPVLSNPLVAYFICSDQEEARRSARNVLRSIIYQLLVKNPLFAKALKKKHKIIDSSHVESISLLWDILRLVVSSVNSQPVVLVIDGFDEISNESKMIFLKQIMDFLAPASKLLSSAARNQK